jgi:regulator of replication initiation timing
MKKIQKNGLATFASLILEKEKLVERLNNKQIEILKKTEKSKIKTPQEKAMLTRTINNVHKIASKVY